MSNRTGTRNVLGFHYRPPDHRGGIAAPAGIAAVCRDTRLRLAEHVYTSGAIEDIGFRQDEVERLLGGVTVGGHRLEDEQQILNLARAWQRMIERVEDRAFALDEETFCALHREAARDTGLNWGLFQDRRVPVGGTYRRVPRTHIVNPRFEPAMQALNTIADAHERAVACFLCVSVNQFLASSNARVAWLVMQGVLMAAGYPLLHTPPSMRMELNIRMMRFYDTLDGSEVMRFLLNHGDAGEEERPKRRGMLAMLGL